MSGNDHAPENGGRARPRRGSTYFIGLLVLLCAAGAIYLWRGVKTTATYTAARSLPAYHRIREEDLRRDEVRSSDLPEDAVTVPGAALGHYTLTNVHQDDPFDATKLGPALSEQALAGRHVIGLPGSSSDVLNGQLARGDRIDVLLSPRQEGAGRGARLRRLLVLDLQRGSAGTRDYVVVLAVSDAHERRMLEAAGSTRAFFTRVAARGGP